MHIHGEHHLNVRRTHSHLLYALFFYSFDVRANRMEHRYDTFKKKRKKNNKFSVTELGGLS